MTKLRIQLRNGHEEVEMCNDNEALSKAKKRQQEDFGVVRVVIEYDNGHKRIVGEPEQPLEWVCPDGLD